MKMLEGLKCGLAVTESLKYMLLVQILVRTKVFVVQYDVKYNHKNYPNSVLNEYIFIQEFIYYTQIRGF
jgi:hypothetical protein